VNSYQFKKTNSTFQRGKNCDLTQAGEKETELAGVDQVKRGKGRGDDLGRPKSSSHGGEELPVKNEGRE